MSRKPSSLTILRKLVADGKPFRARLPDGTVIDNLTPGQTATPITLPQNEWDEVLDNGRAAH